MIAHCPWKKSIPSWTQNSRKPFSPNSVFFLYTFCYRWTRHINKKKQWYLWNWITVGHLMYNMPNDLLWNYKITVPHKSRKHKYIYQITMYYHMYRINFCELNKCALVHPRLSAIFIHMSADLVFFSWSILDLTRFFFLLNVTDRFWHENLS